MNSIRLELALKKQRLQIASETLRAEFGLYATGLTPAFNGADTAVEGARWLRRNPEVVVAAGVALVVIQPKRAWRWARRAFVGWQAWRKVSELMERQRPLPSAQKQAAPIAGSRLNTGGDEWT